MTLSSTLSLVKYRFVDPSDSASVSWFAILETVPVKVPVIAVIFAASAYMFCHLTELVPRSNALSLAGLRFLAVEVVATMFPVISP